MQVLTNVLLVTEAGIFGSWYFSMDSMPSKAGWHSFKRSMTTSFGSICFGSLIVAILDMLRAACRLMQNQAASDGNMIFAAAACVASCCLGCITWLVEFFNRYATFEGLYKASDVKTEYMSTATPTSRSLSLARNTSTPPKTPGIC